MIKTTESVDVIIRDLKLNPKCIHGPTILFSLKNGGNKFFACAANRTGKCFHLDFKDFDQEKIHEFDEPANNVDKPRNLSYEEVKRTISAERIYCETCEIFVDSLSSHESHNFIRGVSDSAFKEPSLFLPQLDNDKLNAQYFFDDNSLDFICAVFEDLKLRKIICIGAPRLHDYIMNKKPQLESILLDIDNRFEAFNSPKEFIRYNLLNNHFLNEDEDKLLNFLRDDDNNNSQHCLFSDPPFAARTELLASAFREFSTKFHKVNSHHKMLPMFLIFPYFNEPHIQKEMPELEMLDFQVSYMNHKAYHEGFKGRKEGSPVRIFTNIDPRLIKFPMRFKGYRFCSFCSRSVAINNTHCKICQACPSKNGAKYSHCPSCILCFKPNYIHCSSCNRCVPKTNHNCSIYQEHQQCWFCSQRGHVEKNCKFMKKFKQKKTGDCAICPGKEKHNLRKCPMKEKLFNNKNLN